MLANLRTKHPIWFAVVVFLIFAVTMQLSSLFGYAIFGIAFISSPNDAMVQNLSQLLGEVVAAIVLCFVLKASGKANLLTKKGKGFFGGLGIGFYVVIFAVGIGIAQVYTMIDSGEFAFNFAPASAVLILAMFSVGIAEELEARALIGNAFLEHFGTTYKGVIKAALLTGVFFGAMHITNALEAPLPETLSQVVLCFTGGVLYAAIYFRSGNIWAIAFLHGLNDVGASTIDWMMNAGLQVTSTVSSFAWTDAVQTVVFAAIDLGVAFFLMRKQRNPELQQVWQEIPQQKQLDKQEETPAA